MLIVPENKISELMTDEVALRAVEDVFAAMATGRAGNFPVVREAIGHEDALYGFKGGFDKTSMTLGLKAGGYWPNNATKHQLINHQSTVFLFDPDTGRLTAAVGGNGLTAFRTAAASAVSIKHLAPEDSRVIGMIGAGHQATFQLSFALQQRNFEKVIGWNRHPEKLQNIAAIAERENLPFKSVELNDMTEADVIITITSSFDAILQPHQVSPGTHLACMGTDTIGKQEVAADLLRQATVFTDEIAQSVSIGEAQHAIAEGLIDQTDITEIGEVINGTHRGRTGEVEITLFDGTGVGLQDLAVASEVVKLAIDKGLATEVEF